MPRRALLPVALATAAVGLAGACTSSPSTTESQGTTTTAAAGTTATTSGPATTLPQIPASAVNQFKATVTANGKDTDLSGPMICRTLSDGRLRMAFGENVDFRITADSPTNPQTGQLELLDGDEVRGRGNAAINASAAKSTGSDALNFSFSASFATDAGNGTMQGSGYCTVSTGSTGTTSSAVPRSTTTAPELRPSLRISLPTGDATAAANDLVTLAKEAPGADADGKRRWYAPEMWQAAGVGDRQAVGSAVPADAQRSPVSGFAPVIDKQKDQQYLAFAVADTNGGCAYGYVVQTDGGTESGTKAATGACTGQAAAEAFGFG